MDINSKFYISFYRSFNNNNIMKRKLFHYRLGFLGVYTENEGESLMSTLGGCFKWDYPFTSDDLWIVESG
jgi:hypothetical protein